MNAEPSGPTSDFVGREAELRLLQDALDEAARGRGRLVLIEGDAGIGKTRLCEELALRARQSGALVLWGRCYEGEGAPVFYPWSQVLRAVLDHVGTRNGERSDQIERIRSLDRALAVEEPGDVMPAALAAGAEARFRLFRTIVEALAEVTATIPVLAIFDDLHCADPASLLLLQFLARELAPLRMMAIGTRRPSSAQDPPLLNDVVAVAARQTHVEDVMLRGLAEADVAGYVAAAMRTQPPPALAAALLRQTEGNPLFLAEFVRMLARERDDDREASPVAGAIATMPVTVRALIGRRLQPLSAQCRRLLARAAVLGRELSFELLDRCTELDGTGAPKDIADTVAEAIAHRILLESDDRRGGLRFAHVLVRDVLYGELSAGERARLHALAGEALARTGGNPAALGQAARHFIAAGRDADLERAVLAAHRAGDHALKVLAFEEAGEMYALALGTAERLPAADEGRRCRLLLARAIAERALGDSEASSATFWQAAELAREVGDVDVLARAAIHYRMPGVGRGPVDERHLMLLEDALERLPAGDGALRAMVMGTLAFALYPSDAAERREQLSGAALAMARRSGDREAIAHALGAREMALWSPDHMALRFEAASQHLELATQLRSPELARQAHVWRLIGFLEQGDVPAADREIAAHRRLIGEVPQARWLDAVWQPMRDLLDGKLDEAEAGASRALEAGTPAESESALAAYSAHLQTLRWEQGRLDELIPMFEQLARQDPRHEFQCVLAFLYAECGRLDDAQLALDTVARDGFRALPRDLNWLAIMTLLATACAALDDRDAARLLYDLLAPFAGRNVVLSIAVVCYGDVARYLGLLAGTLGRHDDAVTHLEAALVTHRRMRARCLVARTHIDLAEALQRRGGPGDGARAAELVALANETAEELGMQGLVRRTTAVGDAGASAAREVANAAEAVPSTAIFRRDGDVWVVCYEAKTIRVRDTRGFHYLALLLRQPGRELHVQDIVRLAGGADGAGRTRQLGELETSHDLGDAGVLLDARARGAYRSRLGELRGDLEEAESANDIGRAERLRTEIETLTEQLVAAGRGRKAASHAERARVTVTKGLKAAVDKIAISHADLGLHLAATVRRGYFCVYLPDPRRPVAWEV